MASEKEIRRTKPSDQTGITRKILERNRIEYIIVKEGDTYENLQKELDLLPFELFRYNGLTRDSVLYAGQELYIQPKRKKAERGYPVHTVKQGETIHSISQMYGVKSERIRFMNGMTPDEEPQEGQNLMLRKKLKDVQAKARRVRIVNEEKEEEDEDESLQFEFR